MDESQLNAEPLDEQAAYWFSALKDEPTAERHAAFLKWMNVSPSHAKEFALAQQVDKRLQGLHLARSIDVDALIERSKQEQRSSRMRAWTGRLAAGIAVAGFLTAGIIALRHMPDTYSTTEAQQLIDLKDGSVVALNAKSQMRVVFSSAARDLYLEKGQGIFKVRHDPRRPFRVHAGTTIVEAVGTQFDVRVDSNQLIVSVLEGVVQLNSTSSAQSVEQGSIHVELPRISAGQSATIRPDGRAGEVKAIDVETVAAWRKPAEQLEFKDKPLSAIANEFNRHNATKLRIEGDELRDRRFVLVFRNASPQSLLNYLAQDDKLEFVHEGDDILIRARD